MNIDTVQKWITKAESDLKIGKDEIITDNPATDAICFHMQQCVEKYLKAYLIFNNKEIRKTHDITEILNACCSIDSEFNTLFDLNVDELTTYAVEVRYSEEFYFPSIEETKLAIEIAEKVKFFVLRKLKEGGYEINL